MPRFDDPRLEHVSSASLTDAMDRLFDHKAHVLDLITPTPGRVLWGPAATIRFIPVRSDVQNDKLHTFARLFYEAVDEPREGQVLILDTSGQFELAIVGGNKVSRLANHGLAGLIADCRFRDFDEIAEQDLSCWCRGESSKAGSSNLMPVGANVPAVIGDVTVLPGDWIYADRAAAVVIPEGHVDAVLDEAIAKEEEDLEKIAAIEAEDPDEILSDDA